MTDHDEHLAEKCPKCGAECRKRNSVFPAVLERADGSWHAVNGLECKDNQIARLQGIVDKLPKTADGVPVAPGMVVWPLHFLEDEQGAEIHWGIFDLNTTDYMDDVSAKRLYSTEAAARAAAQDEGAEG